MIGGAIGTLLGLLTGIVISKGELAIQVTPILVLPMTCYSGLVVNLLTLPDWSSWMQYLSPLRYTYAIVMIDQFSTDKFYHLWDIK